MGHAFGRDRVAGSATAGRMPPHRASDRNGVPRVRPRPQVRGYAEGYRTVTFGPAQTLRIRVVRLGDMDFPDQLTDAHGAGELVVFVGAGVSMPLPTGLPSFKALAVQVGNEAGLPLGRFDQLDAYLGRVSGSGYPVKERVAQIISAGGAPNVLHDAVLGLFKDAASVRIVTTNFDRKLWDVAAGHLSSGPSSTLNRGRAVRGPPWPRAAEPVRLARPARPAATGG
jgi:hypothetical protein